MSRITDRALAELLSRSTKGKWRVGSDEQYRFHVYQEDSSPLRYILDRVPETASNYDLRLMALARELAEEVIELRQKQLDLFKKGK